MDVTLHEVMDYTRVDLGVSNLGKGGSCRTPEVNTARNLSINQTNSM